MDKSKRVKPEIKKKLTAEEKKSIRSASMGGKAAPAAPKKEHEPIITSEEDISKAKEISPFLASGSQDIAVPLSAESIRAFQVYAAMLRKWNEKMNLTNIVDDQGIAIRHFIDSLT